MVLALVYERDTLIKKGGEAGGIVIIDFAARVGEFVYKEVGHASN